MMMQPGYQQPMMQPGYQQPQQIVVMQGGPGATTLPYPGIWGDLPTAVTCHACGATGPTKVDKGLTCCGWLCCIIWLFLFCPVIFCICCCCDSLGEFTHSCGRCGQKCGARIAGNSVNYNWEGRITRKSVSKQVKLILFFHFSLLNLFNLLGSN